MSSFRLNPLSAQPVNMTIKSKIKKAVIVHGLLYPLDNCANYTVIGCNYKCCLFCFYNKAHSIKLTNKQINKKQTEKTKRYMNMYCMYDKGMPTQIMSKTK